MRCITGAPVASGTNTREDGIIGFPPLETSTYFSYMNFRHAPTTFLCWPSTYIGAASKIVAMRVMTVIACPKCDNQTMLFCSLLLAHVPSAGCLLESNVRNMRKNPAMSANTSVTTR